MSQTTLSDRLDARAAKLDSLLCVGLDPHAKLLSAATPEGARDYCLRIVEATADVALAFKPNSAFFEALGAGGMEALREVVAAAGRHAPVILDAKRGDIADTSVAYAAAAFRYLGVDALTVSPYLGSDAIEPFLVDPARGAFVLCKTSNPSSDELQSLPAGGLRLYEQVAVMAQRWNVRGNVGLVVGATDPVALRRARAMAPDLWFLCPGVGAQGGSLDDAVAAGLRPDGRGLLLTVSRSLAMARDPQEEAVRLVEAMRSAGRRAMQGGPRSPVLQELAALLIDCGCVRFGDFVLRSGRRSPIYLDLRVLVSYPRALAAVAAMYAQVTQGLKFDRIGAVPYAGLPIGTAVGLAGGWPMVYARSEVKDHGTKSAVEGAHARGDVVVLVDDVATTGGAILDALSRMRQGGLEARDAVVLVDLESGAGDALAAHGIALHAVARLSELVGVWRAQGRITEQQERDIIGSR